MLFNFKLKISLGKEVKTKAQVRSTSPNGKSTILKNGNPISDEQLEIDINNVIADYLAGLTQNTPPCSNQ